MRLRRGANIAVSMLAKPVDLGPAALEDEAAARPARCLAEMKLISNPATTSFQKRYSRAAIRRGMTSGNRQPARK